mmetsp:Transcript_24470/g.50256  ORF Transcript_24470/g.50256 Transcript_24470/m.50256 type:complete len:754 (+) Transcript_24470:777-3038(+)
MSSSNTSPPSNYSRTSRPSMARTSYSGSTSSYQSPGSQDSPNVVAPSGDWAQSDIRRDVAAGWGGQAYASDVVRGSAAMGGSADSGDGDEYDWILDKGAVNHLPPYYPLDSRSVLRLYLVGDSDKISGSALPLVEVGKGDYLSELKSSLREACELIDKLVSLMETEGGGIEPDENKLRMDVDVMKMEVMGLHRNEKMMDELDMSADMYATLEERWRGSKTRTTKCFTKFSSVKGNVVKKWGEISNKVTDLFGKMAGEKERHVISEVSHRISDACQQLSIQGSWDNLRASATLFSMERVEMVVTMYFDDKPVSGGESEVLLVEIVRRKGCPVTFNKYRRNLFQAAEGKFDPHAFHLSDGLEKPKGRDRCNKPRATLSRQKPTLSRPPLRPPSFSADDAASFAFMKSDSYDSSAGKQPLHEGEEDSNEIIDKALVALNIAASLITKDRVDARRLGMESLILLTDPLRAGIETAKIASRVVLLGTAREDLVWKANDVAVGFGVDEDVDELFDESAGLGIRERILELIMGDDFEGKSSEDDVHGHDGIDKEFRDSMFNSCLCVLSNALNTLESDARTPARPPESADQEDDRKPSPSNRRRAATEPAVRPSEDRHVSKRFIDDTNNNFGCDVLSSLIRILGQAKTNPHDAYQSAKCLGVLFKGCGNSHKARARRDLDAKRIVSAALEVGARSHAKLADASRVAMAALVSDDEDIVEEEVKTEQENQHEDSDHVQDHEMECIDEEDNQQQTEKKGAERP